MKEETLTSSRRSGAADARTSWALRAAPVIERRCPVAFTTGIDDDERGRGRLVTAKIGGLSDDRTRPWRTVEACILKVGEGKRVKGYSGREEAEEEERKPSAVSLRRRGFERERKGEKK